MRVRVDTGGPWVADIEDYARDNVLSDYGEEVARLEKQPGKVAEALGRLLGVLLAKNALTAEEVRHVVSDSAWADPKFIIEKDE